MMSSNMYLSSGESPWVQFKIPSGVPSQERVEAIYEDLCYVHVPALRPEVDNILQIVFV